MAEAVALAASIIAIAGLAFQSAKSLHEFIDGFKNAPDVLKGTNEDLAALEEVLSSLRAAMNGTSDTTFSDKTIECLENVKSPIKGCEKACKAFRDYLSERTRRSEDNHIRWDDKIKLQFEKKTTDFRSQIARYKSSITVALLLVNLKSTERSSQAVRDLRDTITTAMDSLSGQIQGVTISDKVVLEALDEQSTDVVQCLAVCTVALEELNRHDSAVTVKAAISLKEAKQMIAVTIGNVKASGRNVDVDILVADDKAKQVLANTVSADAFKSFMGG